MQITFGYTLYLTAHRSREKQRITILWNILQNFVNALLETHIQHLVGLVQHYVLHIVQLSYTTFHQIN